MVVELKVNTLHLHKIAPLMGFHVISLCGSFPLLYSYSVIILGLFHLQNSSCKDDFRNFFFFSWIKEISCSDYLICWNLLFWSSQLQFNNSFGLSLVAWTASSRVQFSLPLLHIGGRSLLCAGIQTHHNAVFILLPYSKYYLLPCWKTKNCI